MSTNDETVAPYTQPKGSIGRDLDAVRAAPDRLFYVALVAIMALVAVTLLYPDTFTYTGPHFAGFRISPMKIMLALTAPPIAWYIIRNHGRIRLRSFDLVFLPLMLFVAVRGVLGARDSTTAGLDVALVGYAITLYYGSAYLTGNRVARRAINWMLAILGIGIGLYAIVEFFTGYNIYWGLVIEVVGEQANLRHRSVSTIGNPLVLGLFASQVAPLIIYRFSRASRKATRIAWMAGTVVMGLTIAVTLSKGAWITGGLLALAGLGLTFWKWPQARKPALVMLGCTVVLLGVLMPVYYADLKAQTVSENRTRVSIDPRLYMLERFPEAFMQSPLIGFGMREGPGAVGRVDPVDDPDVINPNSLDNIYLTNLVDEGLIGSALILVVTIMLAVQVVRLLRSPGESSHIAIVWAFAMGAVLIDGLTFDTMLYWANMTLFWVMAGMVRAAIEQRRQAGLPTH